LSKLLNEGELDVIGMECHQLGKTATFVNNKWKFDYNVRQYPFNVIPIGKKTLWMLFEKFGECDQIFAITKLKN
jgi:hypothetical protein